MLETKFSLLMGPAGQNLLGSGGMNSRNSKLEMTLQSMACRKTGLESELGCL